MNQSFQDQLQHWCRKNKMSPPKEVAYRQKPQKRYTEHFSESEIKSLMGMDMPTYKRGKGGAWRNGR